jgi:hypothetical protein
MRTISFILFAFVLQTNVLIGQLIIDNNTLSINNIDKSQIEISKFMNVEIANYCDTCDKFTVEITGEQYENTSGVDAFKKMNDFKNLVETSTENCYLLSLQVPDKDKSIVKITRCKTDGVPKLE